MNFQQDKDSDQNEDELINDSFSRRKAIVREFDAEEVKDSETKNMATLCHRHRKQLMQN